jgi:DNA replication protein DnaC
VTESERRDFWEICEDRYQVRSLILSSQLPVTRWHEQIGDPTVADGILDRLVHNAHRVEMRGDSMRKIGVKNRSPEGPRAWYSRARRVAKAISNESRWDRRPVR